MAEFFEYQIANGSISINNVTDNISYCPDHCKGNLAHSDVEHGKVSTVDERGVFVRFKGPNGEKCNPENLHW